MKTQIAGNLIQDEQTFDGAKTQFGSQIKTYDDGNGPLFIMRDSMGILGIVRADSWESAFSIAEDEFFPEATETIEEIQREYNFKREYKKVIRCAIEDSEIHDCLKAGEKFASMADYTDNGKLPEGAFLRWETIETAADDASAFVENELFQESFGLRPNGPNGSDTLKHGIYSKDLNGVFLDLLTAEMVEALGLTLEFGAWE